MTIATIRTAREFRNHILKMYAEGKGDETVMYVTMDAPYRTVKKTHPVITIMDMNEKLDMTGVWAETYEEEEIVYDYPVHTVREWVDIMRFR